MGQQERESSEKQWQKKKEIKIDLENLGLFTIDLIMIWIIYFNCLILNHSIFFIASQPICRSFCHGLTFSILAI